MPAAAVASRTPAMAGMAGTVFGARGEMAVDILFSVTLRCERSEPTKSAVADLDS
jgi:hypothetical protein